MVASMLSLPSKADALSVELRIQGLWSPPGAQHEGEEANSQRCHDQKKLGFPIKLAPHGIPLSWSPATHIDDHNNGQESPEHNRHRRGLLVKILHMAPFSLMRAGGTVAGSP
jgi:hypothetical protein